MMKRVETRRRDGPLRHPGARQGPALAAAAQQGADGRGVAGVKPCPHGPLGVDLESLFLELLDQLQPKPEYLQALRESVLEVWKNRQTEIEEFKEIRQKRKLLIEERKQRLIEAFVYQQAVDPETYEAFRLVLLEGVDDTWSVEAEGRIRSGVVVAGSFGQPVAGVVADYPMTEMRAQESAMAGALLVDAAWLGLLLVLLIGFLQLARQDPKIRHLAQPGRVVRAATAPARCAAIPAAQMNTPTSFSGAAATNSTTSSGEAAQFPVL